MTRNFLIRIAGGEDQWRAYRRLLGYTRPYLRRLIIGGIFGVVFAGSTIGAVGVLRNIMNYEERPVEQVVLFALLLPLITLVRGVGIYFGQYLMQWVGHRTVMDIRVKLFGHLLELPIGFIESNRSGDAIARTVSDVTLVQHSISNMLTDLVKQPVMLVFAAGYLVYFEWQLAVLSFFVFPIFVLPAILLGHRVKKATRQGQERLADIVEIMQETLSGARIVKAFQMEAREADRFRDQCMRFFGRIMRVVRANAMMTPIVEFTAIISLVAAFFYAFRSGMPFPDFIIFAIGLALMYDPCKKLGKMHIHIQQASAAAERIFEILDEDASIVETANAEDFEEPLQSIEFENVTFAYEDSPVLDSINFSVKAGERIAVVGMSGAGKTTLVSLLLRFFDTKDGSIRFNGRDVRDLTLGSVRRLHGVVTQDTILFNDTVAGNIAYGDPSADRDRIREAARRAHADEFIVDMAEGYDTVIGERGLRLSGGQRQRLAIARAMLLDPPVLILDEATSALDSESERLVQEALAEVMQSRTVFAIAHRLSTIMNCDRVLVLDQGRLVEQGTHQELLDAGGIYKRLYDLQFNAHEV